MGNRQKTLAICRTLEDWWKIGEILTNWQKSLGNCQNIDKSQISVKVAAKISPETANDVDVRRISDSLKCRCAEHRLRQLCFCSVEGCWRSGGMGPR